ncbi:MAG: TetR family transcriptional regulator [Chromatiales bacterium]|nr:TetR family transcriptional regulator [Chromatiales bacterium]
MASDTKEAILNAAEDLFAAQGIETTSLRAITGEAKVNLAAVSYHFGSKQALVAAVFERRLLPMNRERLRCLDELERSGMEIPLEALVRAYISPALAMSRDPGGERFVRLLGRSYSEPSHEVHGWMRAAYTEVIARFKPAFARALPDLPAQELHWRLHFMLGTLAYCMAGTDVMRLIASSGLEPNADPGALERHLVNYVSAGLAAPPSD